jgi:hypothetical protein
MWKRSMARIVRHRQPKGPETDKPNLTHRAATRLHHRLATLAQTRNAGSSRFAGPDFRASYLADGPPGGLRMKPTKMIALLIVFVSPSLTLAQGSGSEPHRQPQPNGNDNTAPFEVTRSFVGTHWWSKTRMASGWDLASMSIRSLRPRKKPSWQGARN